MSQGRAHRQAAAKVLRLLLTSSFLLPPSAVGWAAHPFITDDTGTQGAGKWQLELLAERNRHDSTAPTAAGPVQQERRFSILTPVLTAGVRDNVDLALGLSRLRQRVTENGVVTEDVRGASDTSVDLKWRFHDAGGTSLALKPSLLLPTGDEARGLGTGRTSYGLVAIATREAEPWTFSANLAYARLRYKRPQDAAGSHGDLWRLSGGASYAVREGMKLVGELGARTNEARDDPFLPGRNGHYAMLGLIYSPAKQLDLDVGFRKSVNHAELDRAFLAGATFRW